jgi:hypothetical protein
LAYAKLFRGKIEGGKIELFVGGDVVIAKVFVVFEVKNSCSIGG